MQKFIFYVVEIRTWNDGTAFPYVRNRIGFTKDYIEKNKFKITKEQSDSAELECGRFTLKIQQSIFKDLEAAKSHFASLKKFNSSEIETREAMEASLMQVEATSVNNARVLPPNSYAEKNTIWLEIYTPDLSNEEYRNQKSI
jgi:hypothetical protein